MNRILSVNLENCFGIGKLEHVFKFTPKERAQLIYAPNGTMKSSFANIFDLLAQNKKNEVKDRVFTDKTTIVDVKMNNLALQENQILVVNAETKMSQGAITKFIARADLKTRYDEIYKELVSEKDKFISLLKKQSRSSDCDNELKVLFNENESFYEFLVRVEPNLSNSYDKYDFKYNDIFDKGHKVKAFLQANQGLLDDYLQRYSQLLEQSKFFKKSSNSFGTVQASSLLNSLNDNSFFEAGHTINLSSTDIISSKGELSDLITNELNQILSDVELLKVFEKVDKALAKNAELKAFKVLLEKDQSILIELQDYEGFRNKFWLSHISELSSETVIILDIYKQRRTELQKIIENANEDVEKWNKTIEIFNSRFYVPFTIHLENQSDIILKNDIPKLIFKYKESNIPNNEESVLLEILSRGESRAYFILRFLFEIQARIDIEEELLVIFDDVADSFDYKNKYAIIEYIKELIDNPKVNAIILTHNFDFYRTVAKRLFIKKTSFMASKCSQNIVKINKGKYFEDVFKNIFLNKYDQEKNFIGLIPFIRNLFEYLTNDEGYNFLTNCLHIKPDTRNITAGNIHNVFTQVISIKSDINLSFKDKKILDMVFDQAEIILNTYTEHSIDLEDKLIIAMACRLKAELFMISKLPLDKVESINENQTQQLYQLCKDIGLDENILKLLNRVNLITPEHLHLNSFMFEPLVDMSINNLVSLYKELCELVIENSLVV